MDSKEITSLLFSAIQHHNDSLLDDLLAGDEAGSLLNIPGEDGNTLLHFAVIESDLKCVECLLRHGADPNVFDSHRARSPLHLTVELGHREIAETFLKLEHVNLDLRDDRNLTCYEIAQFCDNHALADIIGERQEAIRRHRDEFYTHMNQACTSNDPKLVKQILERYERKIINNLPRGWHSSSEKKLFARSSLKELINWSSSSWNDVTLLFKSASKGHTEICQLLIEFGATAKCNENTNYSPLYVAAYGGFTGTVELLLKSFPTLVQEVTIEKWTVLHACCLQGHQDTAKLILTYPYPQSLKRRFVSRSGIYEYHFAFDLNAQDAAGQTVIYLAVSANNDKLLDTLLQFNVEAKLLNGPTPTTNARQPDLANENHVSANNRRARIIPDRPAPTQVSSSRPNGHLDKILRQLRKIGLDRGDTKDNEPISHPSNSLSSGEYLICPFEMDTYCDYNSKTALHLAVCHQYHDIATTLLVNGSNPNLPILCRDSIKSDYTNSNSDSGLNWLRSSKSTCLKEACRLNDVTMCEILIRYGASDNQDNLALQVAASNKSKRLISLFLSLKSNVDPEFKINKKCNVEFASRYKQSQKLASKLFQGGSVTTFSSMFPSTPVTIDWQGLKCIRQLDPQWLIDASLMHNKKLRHPTNSLIAITRLDLSSNNLKTIHPVIFRLPSLRELNLANNRLESLFDFSTLGLQGGDATISTSKLIESHRTAMKRSKSSTLTSINLESSNIIDLNEMQEWDLPYLETLDLHDNLLLALPDCLFKLPRLSELDVSSNQIRQLPWAIWTAPSLRELIASGNLLDDLPRAPTMTRPSTSSSTKSDLIGNLSTLDEGSSIASDQLVVEERFDSSLTDSNSSRDPFYMRNITSESIEEIEVKCSQVPLIHINNWSKKLDLVSDNKVQSRNSGSEQVGNQEGGDCPLLISKLTHLNLSHNSFTVVPPILACITTELTRLNLSFNRIETMGDISLYPAKLKNLDLSNNQLVAWFQFGQQDSDTKHCYAENIRMANDLKPYRAPGNLHCIHKTHQCLDCIRSINLAHNSLKEIQLYNPIIDLSLKNQVRGRDSHSNLSNKTGSKAQLLYPNITALDISFNEIQRVSEKLSELKDLSVLNLSGNVAIATLPAELGLASKLWNLGVVGCNLSEPLKSIVESKTYKTMDVIGYLRSILEEAKPYARMKLMLVGLQGIGKTSLLEQIRQEGSTGSRKRAPEHWTRRMGHTSKGNLRTQKGVTLSTVGVDIHDWIFCKRTARNQHSFGPVSFSTWDFGGQEEFYATHRYFLSRRSLYLVVWRLTDGLEGILGIQQWLVNIQSRASGSPVIIVGTHEDMVEGGERGSIVQQLQAEVHKRFIDVSDHDKCGLPRVMDSMVISTKTKLNIKNLCNRIYDIVFSLRCPGSTERLLEQKIPATYLYLEEIVHWIVADRQQKKREPVLIYDEYKSIASMQLKTKYNKTFRDLEPMNSRDINYNSELHQATRFLHENGVLLHYEDANLRDLYFLDPQWLCDILSNVVTIREINPHVKNGLMKMDNLGFLFKSMEFDLSGGVQSYVVNLLNKFEVALTWNSQYLLIPSLLPDSPEQIDFRQDFQVKVTPRMRGRSVARRLETQNRAHSARSTSVGPRGRATERSSMSATGLAVASSQSQHEFELQPDKTIVRLVLLRYLPAGFLARLQSGILSDPIFDDICAEMHSNLLQELGDLGEGTSLSDCIGNRPSWLCWRSGIRLSLQKESTINAKQGSNSSSPCILSVQEFGSSTKNFAFARFNFKIDCVHLAERETKPPDDADFVTNNWCDLDISQYSSTLMVVVPNYCLKIINKADNSLRYIQFNNEITTKLLSKTVDHIDNLLEDWYPSLGARFAHTLGGDYLVLRIVPCLCCASELTHLCGFQNSDQRQSKVNSRPTRFQPADGGGDDHGGIRFSLVAARNELAPSKTVTVQSSRSSIDVHCYYVEHCILNAYNLTQKPFKNSRPSKMSINQVGMARRSRARHLNCPRHGLVFIDSVAPDVVFEDLPEALKIDNEQIERSKLIGRGTLGFVFKASLRSEFPLNQLAQGNQEVALKLLQPVEPGPNAEHSDTAAYNSARSNWTREPFQSACKSYCTARHEINILQTLTHPNIVGFIGLCMEPLAIVLELAPLGSLTDVFKNYKRAGMRIDQDSVRKSILQVARALEFLHQQRVIYRDLKTENILVWSFPSPYATCLHTTSVELKLADYGISRQASSMGIWKGFAGTLNFLAPEILRHNGDEEYTEKVDCFSLGMFMYELLTLRAPYKHIIEGGARCHLSDGGRPTLARRDLIYPDYMFDLMSICLSQQPHLRPTASQIVSIASTPEFMQVLEAVEIDLNNRGSFFAPIQYEHWLDFWYNGPQMSTMSVLSASNGHWTSNQIIEMSLKNPITCMCVVENRIWFCDSSAIVHIFPTGPRLIHHKQQEDLNKTNFMSSPEPFCDEALEAPDLVQSFVIDMRKEEPDERFAIRQMDYVEAAKCVLLLTTNGEIWIYRLATMSCEQLENGSMAFNCLAVPPSTAPSHRVAPTRSPPPLAADWSATAESFSIFCGQANGISCLEVSHGGEVLRQSILPLAGKTLDSSGEQIVEPSQSTSITSIVASEQFLWTSADCTVHLWDVSARQVVRKLDCWKLVPCSESLESINIEQYYQQARTSKVSSMVRSNKQLFVGTSHGCFIVIEADTLKPLVVFRPYESDITILDPIRVPRNASSISTSSLSSPSSDDDNSKYLIALGTNYRDLLSRYVNSIGDVASRPSDGSDVAILIAADQCFEQQI